MPQTTFGQRGWYRGASYPGPALWEQGLCMGHHADCPPCPGVCMEPLATIPSHPAALGAMLALTPSTMARVSSWMSGNEAAWYTQLWE